jgi:hypothetical protein
VEGEGVLRVFWAAGVVVGALPVSRLVTVGLLPPMLLFLTLQTLAELTVPGALAVVVDGLEGTFPPVVTLAVHGRQSPEELAGGWAVEEWRNLAIREFLRTSRLGARKPRSRSRVPT